MYSLRIGDVLNTKNPVKYWPPKVFLGWAFKLGVYEYQKALFKQVLDRESLWATHSRIYLGKYMWLSVTSPKAKIERLLLEDYDKPFTVCRYIGSSSFGETQEQELIDTAKKFEGTGYDYIQIATMALHKLFPHLVSGDSKLLQADGDKVVCSVGALACLIAAWKKTDRTIERPGGDPMTGDGLYLEEFPPAGFNNHRTFEVIYKKDWE